MRAKRKKKPNDPWAILNYEIQMYLGARYSQGFLPHDPKTGRATKDPIILTIHESAMVEVKLLHIRILAELFLEGRTNYRDNISIDDMLPQWRAANPTALHNLQDAYSKKLAIGFTPRTLLNKYLAHPDRHRGPSFNWAPLVRRMDPPMKAVLRTLPSNPRLNTLHYFRNYLR